jgi:predicted SnoaL-like aldol condensation-catalyzing enzyme
VTSADAGLSLFWPALSGKILTARSKQQVYALRKSRTQDGPAFAWVGPFFLGGHMFITARWVSILIFTTALSILAQPAWANEDLTARNKAVVRDFYTTVLIGRDVDAAPRFLREDYIQHNPQVPTGLKGFMDTFRERFAQKLPPDYKRELLNVIGENDMVVIYVRQTWTGRDGQHHEALGFDMFRVQDGKIAEHWDAD